MVCVSSWSLCGIFLFFYAKENSDPEVDCLALWRVGNHAEWRGAHSRPSVSSLFSHLESGLYVMSPCIWQFLFAVWCLAQCLVRQRIHVLRFQDGFWKLFYDFLRDWVDSAPEVDSLVLTGDAPVARLLSLEICTLFLRVSWVFQLDLSSNFCAS